MNANLLAVLLAFCLFTAPIAAQPNTCGGLYAVKETVLPTYPPIARAAHFGGLVTVMTSFRPDGQVRSADVLTGPKLLEIPALLCVKGLRANEFTGPRTCAIVVRYELNSVADSVDHIDPQHVVIKAKPTIISDPPMYTTRSKCS